MALVGYSEIAVGHQGPTLLHLTRVDDAAFVDRVSPAKAASDTPTVD
ncbi:MAG: hypothetical protein AB7S74_16005 [Hyphomicrobium sp.]